MDFGKIFMRQGMLLGHFLCDRVQGAERFATHPRHFPSQVPPGGSVPSRFYMVGVKNIQTHMDFIDLYSNLTGFKMRTTGPFLLPRENVLSAQHRSILRIV